MILTFTHLFLFVQSFMILYRVCFIFPSYVMSSYQ